MRIIAHRGASVAAPENTMAAFALARSMGADGIEIDVQATADDGLVVFHDQDTEALCGRAAVVRNTPLARLRELEVDGSGAPMPTLEEVLRSPDRPPRVTIEIKTYRVSDTRVADLVGRLLQGLEPALREQVVVSSFHPYALFKSRRHVPDVRRGLLSMSAFHRPLREMWARRLVGASELHVEASMVDERRVRTTHAAGRELVAWTVNEPHRVLELFELGVDAIMTDVPDVARCALEHGVDAANALLAERYPGFDPRPKPLPSPPIYVGRPVRARTEHERYEEELEQELEQQLEAALEEHARAGWGEDDDEVAA